MKPTIRLAPIALLTASMLITTGCRLTLSGDAPTTATATGSTPSSDTGSSAGPGPAQSTEPAGAANAPRPSESSSAGSSTSSVVPTEPGSSGQGSDFTPAPPELESCLADMVCGTVEVPLDSADLSLGTLGIAISVHRATEPDQRIGILMVNPGGPGASGIEFAARFANGEAAREIVKRFDIVGFDPRGVADSEPEFECGSDQEWVQREIELDGVVDTDDDIAAARAAVQSCVTSMGPAAMRLGTEYVVQDMDYIREALGEDTMSYYGASYGSTIGMWYASRFPERVRAMVVDASDNPVDDLSTDEAAVQSALAETVDFEAALRSALEACNYDTCPIYNGGDPVGFYLEHVDQLVLVDEQYGGKPTAGSLGLVTTLYNEGDWPLLWDGLASLSKGDPDLFVELANFQLQGEIGASITGHINCLDRWGSHPDLTEDDEVRRSRLVYDALIAEQPLITAMPWMEVPDFCPFYDEQMPEPGGPLRGGGVPIVVVANKSDPITPFAESLELAENQLDNGYLVEVDHPGHVVYGRDRCVSEIVDSTIIDGAPPPERRTVCS